jgi:8-oxo-dGTP diphosphatase
MSNVLYRRRGTAIVETGKGILLTAGRHGVFILPGGGAKRGESRFVAALRELTEETGLLPYSAEIIFKYLGKIRPTMSGKHKFQDHHTVCVVKASGKPKPGGGDAKRISYYYSGCDIQISTTTQEIINRYFEWKQKQHTADDPKIVDEDEDIEDIEDNSSNECDSGK